MFAGLLAVFIPTVSPVFPIEAVKSAAADLAECRRVVTAAGQRDDAESLLAFFRQRTLTLSERDRLLSTIRRLGDDRFEVRENASADLVTAGIPALHFLNLALTDPDLEISRRAERCIERIRRGPGPQLPTAAARLLAIRKPSGATQALLDYVPFADDEYVEEAVFVALTEIGSTRGKVDPLFERVLDDAEAARRAAAARVLGQADDPAQRRLAHRLLGDTAISVRIHAARALLAKGDKTAVPTLIALLTESPPSVAWDSEEMLGRLAGPTAPEVHLDITSDSTRSACRIAWESWWRANERLVDLSRFTPDSRLLGMTLIADLDKGRVVEIARDHTERWSVTGFGGPVDVQYLPNGRILVAENHARKVTERDKTGKVVWEKSTPAFPASCQRLANGNTFIATYNQILEVTPDGRETLKLAQEGIYCARKVRNGRIVLVNTTGRVATLDPAGKEVSAFETGGIANWSSIEVLNNGHVLACVTGNKVVEFDDRGRRAWECSVPYAVCATRLPNGNTLVCSSEGRRVVEVDRSGKEAWEHRTVGRPWHAVRR